MAVLFTVGVQLKSPLLLSPENKRGYKKKIAHDDQGEGTCYDFVCVS